MCKKDQRQDSLELLVVFSSLCVVEDLLEQKRVSGDALHGGEEVRRQIQASQSRVRAKVLQDEIEQISVLRGQERVTAQRTTRAEPSVAFFSRSDCRIRMDVAWDTQNGTYT